MKRYAIACIPGDGIGGEVIGAGMEVLAAAQDGFALDFTTLPWGSDYFLEHGRMMPADGLDTLRAYDAIYFGSAGDPRVADHITLWGLRLAIVQGFDQYANVRPARLLPGLAGRLRGVDTLDWVVVRENSEGEYAGAGGQAHGGLDGAVAVDVSIFTRAGIERIMRFGFDLARRRPRKHLTCVTKSNAQRHGMVMWDEVFAGMTQDYPDIETEKVLVDAMAARMVTTPDRVDVVVASNLHADILSDLAGALTGSLGLAPSANLDPTGSAPSMFEPVHGSAFEIVGKGVANPIGAVASGAMMLDHLGEGGSARRITAAIDAVTRDGAVLPRDLGGTASSAEVTQALIGVLEV